MQKAAAAFDQLRALNLTNYESLLIDELSKEVYISISIGFLLKQITSSAHLK